jgi:hypothetical protein
MERRPTLPLSKRRTSRKRTSNKPIPISHVCPPAGMTAMLSLSPAHVFSPCISITLYTVIDSRIHDGENGEGLALTTRTPSGIHYNSSDSDYVACRLSVAHPNPTSLRESPQTQPVLTPSAQHWYPFGSFKNRGAMQESYKGTNLKQRGSHPHSTASLTECNRHRLHIGHPLT